MDKQLSCFPFLSLREMALRKVAVVLWTKPRILVSVENFQSIRIHYHNHLDIWQKAVESTLSKVRLPESMAKQVKPILKPIGLQILRWKWYHEAYLNSHQFFDLPILEKLQWSANGTVDDRKTAEELVRCNVLNIVKRYKLACLYCLDNYIPDLWKELPQEDKLHFYFRREGPCTNAALLPFCWPYILERGEYRLARQSGDSIALNQSAFQHASCKGNKAAAKYFLQRLSLEEREASLVSTANHVLHSRITNQNLYPCFPNKNISDVIFYLLSEMTPEEQVQILTQSPAHVFECFFDWPWQDAFFYFADAIWTWMHSDDLVLRARNYNTLIDKMRIIMPNPEYPLPNLYRNFFMSSPSDFKEHFVNRECRECRIFKALFRMEDTETIHVILSNLDAISRRRLTSSERMLQVFYDSIYSGSGHVVEKFLREAGLSQEDKESMKAGFMRLLRRMRFLRSTSTVECGTPKWRIFFDFLDATDVRAKSKRSSDGETSTEAKKICSEGSANSAT